MNKSDINFIIEGLKENEELLIENKNLSYCFYTEIDNKKIIVCENHRIRINLEDDKFYVEYFRPNIINSKYRELNELSLKFMEKLFFDFYEYICDNEESDDGEFITYEFSEGQIRMFLKELDYCWQVPIETLLNFVETINDEDFFEDEGEDDYNDYY